MSACTHCQLARHRHTDPAGYIRCGHRISADTMAVIRARVNPVLARQIADKNDDAPMILQPDDQPAMCPVRVPPHAATPQQAAA